MSMQTHFEIFISHAAIDQPLATALKDHLASRFPALRVFVSSDPEDLPPGSEWINTILSALESAELVLALTTERGLSRHWVWFECGRTWFSGVPMIPCCIGNKRKSDLPSPFSQRQALNLDIRADVIALDGEIVRLLKAEISPTAVTLHDEVAQLDAQIVAKTQCATARFDPDEVSNASRLLASLHPSERTTIRDFVRRGVMSTAGARAAARAARVDFDGWSVPRALASKTGFIYQSSGPNGFQDTNEESVFTMPEETRRLLGFIFSEPK